METPKFTKGPWLVHDTYDDYHEYSIDNPQIIVWDGDEQASQPICDMGEMGDFNYAECLANAKLISAAPELYETLEDLMAFVVKHVDVVDCSEYNRAYRIIKKINE